MAAPVCCLPNDDLASRLVQKIAQTVEDEIPEQFLHKDGFPEAKDVPELWTRSLLIDFSLLSSGDQDEIVKFRSALSNWGCFLVKNHGIEGSFLEEVIEVSRKFFSLPFEEKMKYYTDDIFQGYDTDAVCQGLDQQKMNWNDRLFLTMYPKSKGNLKAWPQNPSNFSEIVDEYSKELINLTKGLYKAAAKSLNVREDSFCLEKEGVILSRFTLYPKCPRPKNVLGSKPHLDGSVFTIVLADQEGLEVQKDGQWFKVPVIPGALFVNFGDFGEVLTNGIYKSTMHRVATHSAKDRLSVTAFCTMDATQELTPLTELVTANRPPLYKKFKVYEYKEGVCCKCGPGENAIDAIKLDFPIL
uniref:Salt-induced protein n=1 Tax=Atriplex nummularia TaxID=3553 RepID=Q7XZR2_ATRNU|nr:salt-induced protein [Atriplex nummularia]